MRSMVRGKARQMLVLLLIGLAVGGALFAKFTLYRMITGMPRLTRAIPIPLRLLSSTLLV